MEEEKIINSIKWGIDNNYDILLLHSNQINYNEQRIIWDEKEIYYIKNIKIEYILKEIKDYVVKNKKTFIKLIINDLSNNVDGMVINTPWEIIDKNIIEKLY